MNIIRKAISTFAGISLAVLLFAALAPKATRGVAAALVQVTNTTSNPVNVSDVAPSQLFQATCANLQGNSESDSCTISVPPGKRLVVQTVSVEGIVNPGVRVVFARFTPRIQLFPTQFYVVVPFTGNITGSDISEMSQDLRMYTDQTLVCDIVFSQATEDEFICAVAGYLVDIP